MPKLPVCGSVRVARTDRADSVTDRGRVGRVSGSSHSPIDRPQGCRRQAGDLRPGLAFTTEPARRNTTPPIAINDTLRR
jgi:hypothetical protein